MENLSGVGGNLDYHLTGLEKHIQCRSNTGLLKFHLYNLTREFGVYSPVRFIKAGAFAVLCLPGILAAQNNDSYAPRQEPKNENFNSQSVQPAALQSRVGDFLVSPYQQIGPV